MKVKYKTFLDCDSFLYYFNNQTMEFKEEWNLGELEEQEIKKIKEISEKYSEEEIRTEYSNVILKLQENYPFIMFCYNDWESNDKIDKIWEVFYKGSDNLEDMECFHAYKRDTNCDTTIPMFPIILEQDEESLNPIIYDNEIYFYRHHISRYKSFDRICVQYNVVQNFNEEDYYIKKENIERDFVTLYKKLFNVEI